MSSSAKAKSRWRTGGGTVALPLQKKGARFLRLATLSFRTDRGHGGLSRVVLARALSTAFGARRVSADLVLAAGHSLASEPKPSTILEATDGVPVLLEVRERPEGPARWVLFAKNLPGTKAVLREEQIVQQIGSSTKAFGTLRSVLLGGKGHVVFEGTGVRAVLLICGENNALNRKNLFSVFRGRPRSEVYAGSSGGGDPLLDESWLVLNPAHGAYGAIGTTRAGWGKVGSFIRKGRRYKPLLQQWTYPSGKPYRDGTRDPFAVLHCNNFTGDPRTIRLASRLFTLGRSVHANMPRHAGRSSEQDWVATVYNLPLPVAKGR